MRRWAVLLTCMAGCGSGPEPNLELTLAFGEVTPDMLGAGTEWGGLVAAPPDDLTGTVKVVARERPADLGEGGVILVQALPERRLGTIQAPGTAWFWLEPGQRTLIVTDVHLPHPGCTSGSEPQSYCYANGWEAVASVEVPEAGTTAHTVELWPACGCDD